MKRYCRIKKHSKMTDKELGLEISAFQGGGDFHSEICGSELLKGFHCPLLYLNSDLEYLVLK